MNKEAQNNLLLFVGTMILQVGWSDLHLRYVKAVMQPYLIASGLVLMAIGAAGLIRQYRASRPGKEAAIEGGHEHRQPGTAWLLALPLLVLILVTPPSLGAFAASREATRIEEPTVRLPELPAAQNGAVDLGLTDYYTRVSYAPESLAGTRVRLTGFVTAGDADWYVTRIRLSCCAADGRPVKVLTDGAAAPPSDSWVEVIGTMGAPRSPAGSRTPVPVIEVESVLAIQAPRVTYEQ